MLEWTAISVAAASASGRCEFLRPSSLHRAFHPLAMASVSPRRLVIATRESALAMWQAKHIRARLLELYPSCEVELLGLTTQGDRVLDQALADIGGKGLFIKELEIAM